MLDELSPACWLVVGSHDLRSEIRRPDDWQVTLLECPPAALAPASDAAVSYTLDLRDWQQARALVQHCDGTVSDRSVVSPQEILDQGSSLPIGLLRPESPSSERMRVYPQVDLYHGHARFLRLPGEPVPRASAVPALLAGIDEYFLKVANYLCFRINLKPDVELEHKFTLTGNPDVYPLARDVLRFVEAGRLTGFGVEFREEIQSWDFLNHVYAIEEPADQAGYVSFIPTTDGRHTVKRKFFTEDTDERIELRTRKVDVGPSLEAYVRDALGLTPAWNASFRRVRYDVSVESIETGNVIVMAFDRSTIIDASGKPVPGLDELTQCEMEYVYSQALEGASFDSVRADLEQLRVLMSAYFAERDLDNYQRHESKLTFLRDQYARLR